MEICEMSSIERFWCGLLLTVLFSSLLHPATGSAETLSPSEQRGLVFVNTHCSRCHSIYKLGASQLKIAPPFRTLHLRYPIESLQESLAEGIITGHPSMPEFRLDPDQVADVIAYLKSLER
jgi:cytochrome c